MNLFRANFDELYRRHLCRHSDFGINVLHLIAVAGVYVSLFGLTLSAPFGAWIAGVLLAAYFALLAFNVPIRVLLANALTVGVFLGICLALPPVSPLVFVISAVVSHRFQLWNHRVYPKSLDMSEFSEKYRKGFALFVLLAVYELPILMNYLVFEGDRSLQATSLSDRG